MRTGSAAIFAADSKVTTQGLAGFEGSGGRAGLGAWHDHNLEIERGGKWELHRLAPQDLH